MDFINHAKQNCVSSFQHQAMLINKFCRFKFKLLSIPASNIYHQQYIQISIGKPSGYTSSNDSPT